METSFITAVDAVFTYTPIPLAPVVTVDPAPSVTLAPFADTRPIELFPAPTDIFPLIVPVVAVPVAITPILFPPSEIVPTDAGTAVFSSTSPVLFEPVPVMLFPDARPAPSFR